MATESSRESLITNLFSSESGWIERNFPGKVKAAHIHRPSPMINSRKTLRTRSQDVSKHSPADKIPMTIEEEKRNLYRILTFNGGPENSSSVIFNNPLSETNKRNPHQETRRVHSKTK